MTTRTNAFLQEKYQKIALCAQTYFNLYGKMPACSQLCEMLGPEYRPAILLYLHRGSADISAA